MAYENFEKVVGIIQEIRSGSDCCSQMVSLMTEQGEVNLILSPQTQVIGSVRLRRGMRVAGFYDTSLPAPAVFPPQYQAEIITPLRREQNVTLNYFDENLVAEDNSLALKYKSHDKCGYCQWSALFLQSRKCRASGVLYDNYIQYTAADFSPEDCGDVS